MIVVRSTTSSMSIGATVSAREENRPRMSRKTPDEPARRGKILVLFRPASPQFRGALNLEVKIAPRITIGHRVYSYSAIECNNVSEGAFRAQVVNL
jgi:hypothetical protein